MPISVEKNYPEGGNSISAKWLQPWLKENAKRELIARIYACPRGDGLEEQAGHRAVACPVGARDAG